MVSTRFVLTSAVTCEVWTNHLGNWNVPLVILKFSISELALESIMLAFTRSFVKCDRDCAEDMCNSMDGIWYDFHLREKEHPVKLEHSHKLIAAPRKGVRVMYI